VEHEGIETSRQLPQFCNLADQPIIGGLAVPAPETIPPDTISVQAQMID
jgi:hypothetical protein